MVTCALILTGELRFKDRAHFEHFKSFFAGYDIFISTYEDYDKLCAELTNTYLLHPRDVEGESDPGGIHAKGTVLQWFHLDKILKTYESQLLKYDVLVKVRSDLLLTEKSWEDPLHDVDKETMYMKTDYLFYARSAHFIKTLKDFYPKIKTHYWKKTFNYIPLNYDNILNSGDDCTPENVRFPWLFLPAILIQSQKNNERNFLTLKALIKEHYDFLADFNSFQHPSTLPIECFRSFPPKIAFSSEQVFCIESFNAGLVKNSIIPAGLMKGRYYFKFDPDDPLPPPPPPLQWPTAR